MIKTDNIPKGTIFGQAEKVVIPKHWVSFLTRTLGIFKHDKVAGRMVRTDTRKHTEAFVTEIWKSAPQFGKRNGFFFKKFYETFFFLNSHWYTPYGNCTT